MTVKTSQPILVTGATGGKQGSTGRKVVELLREKDLPVRAFVWREDDRSEDLKAFGAEVFVGDLLNADDVFKSFEGVKRAYFAFPVKPGLLHATTHFAAAARRVETEVVVDLGHLNNAFDAPSPRTREHWMSEQIFDWAGINAAHLHAGVFMENVLRGSVERVRSERKFTIPMGAPNMPIPLIAGIDVARVSAAVLADPSAYAGRAFPISTVMTTPTGIAEAYSRVLGEPVIYEPISEAQWRTDAFAREGANAEFEIEHLTKLWWTLAHPDPAHAPDLRKITESVGEIIGAEPLSFEAFLAATLKTTTPA